MRVVDADEAVWPALDLVFRIQWSRRTAAMGVEAVEVHAANACQLDGHPHFWEVHAAGIVRVGDIRIPRHSRVGTNRILPVTVVPPKLAQL